MNSDSDLDILFHMIGKYKQWNDYRNENYFVSN